MGLGAKRLDDPTSRNAAAAVIEHTGAHLGDGADGAKFKQLGRLLYTVVHSLM